MATVVAPRATARSVARVAACALWGLESAMVTVETDVANGLPSFTVVGMPDAAVSEARERVRAAIRNSGFEFPLRRVVVNLAPAERRKEGTGFDLAIALGVLRATGQLTRDVDALCLAELALDGRLRPVRGVMARVRWALSTGVSAAFVAQENAAEAAALGAESFGFSSLREVVEHVEGRACQAPSPAPPVAPRPSHPVDLADIAGHQTPKRALEVAAAGGHSLLLVGPPGARRSWPARSRRCSRRWIPTRRSWRARCTASPVSSLTSAHCSGRAHSAPHTTPPLISPWWVVARRRDRERSA